MPDYEDGIQLPFNLVISSDNSSVVNGCAVDIKSQLESTNKEHRIVEEERIAEEKRIIEEQCIAEEEHIAQLAEIAKANREAHKQNKNGTLDKITENKVIEKLPSKEEICIKQEISEGKKKITTDLEPDDVKVKKNAIQKSVESSLSSETQSTLKSPEREPQVTSERTIQEEMLSKIFQFEGKTKLTNLNE